MVLNFQELGEGDTRTVEFDPHDRRWQTEDEDRHTGDEHGALPLVAVVDKVSNTQLDRGNHGCQGSEGKRQEEHRRHDEWADRAPGACAKTSGSARNVMADEPPVTVASGSGFTAKMAERTASPAMMEMLLLANPMVKALRTVSSSFRM